MEKQEHLKNAFQNRLDHEFLIAEKIDRGEDPYFLAPHLEGSNIVYAIYRIYMENEFQNAKTYFFKSACVAEYMSIKYDMRIIESGINSFSCALLSDNDGLIHRYAVLKNTKNNETGIGYQICNAIQNILLDNYEKLEKNTQSLSRLVKVPRFKWWAPMTDVFTGFLNSDSQKIKTALGELAETDMRRNTDPLLRKFFSIDTAGLCKLSWRKGYKIDLQSSLVPRELMPILPLPIYEDYGFLKI